MLLGGLWHGAAWNFLVWGGFHGVILALERSRGKEDAYAGFPKPVRIAWTFLLVLVSWVFFRAADLSDAVRYLGHMVGVGAGPAAGLVGELLYRPYYLGTFVAAAAVTWTMPQTWDWTRRLTWTKALVCLGVLALALVMMETQGFNPFIYFIF